MPVSEAQKNARNKYDKENMDRVTIKVKKELLKEFRQTVEKRGDKVNTVLKQAEKYKKGKYLVNQNSEIQIGKYRDSQTKEEKNIYRILLDIDVYDERLDDNEIDLNEMNLIVFEIYKANLKEEFLEMLKKEKFESEEIFKL